MINIYDSILRGGLPIGGAPGIDSASMLRGAPGGNLPSPSLAPPAALPAQAPPAPQSRPEQSKTWTELMQDPSFAKAMTTFGQTALQAREKGVSPMTGMGMAVSGFSQAYVSDREKRISTKRARLKEELDLSRLKSGIEKDELALEGIRAERAAVESLAGKDQSLLDVGRIDPASLLRLKYPEAVAGGIGKDLGFANALSEARKAGDIQRVNDLMYSRKIQKLEPGQQFDPITGEIITTKGFVPSVTEIAGAKAGGAEKAKLEEQLKLKPKIAAAEKTAVNLVEKRASYPKATATLRAMDQSYKNVDGYIDEAMEDANAWTTGFMGKITSYLPGTAASNLAATLDTIKANLGFDKLQDMRNNSVTGGALGQVSEMENKLLQSVWGSLLQSQTEAQFKDRLQKVKEQRRKSWNNIKKAYQQDYGTIEGFEMPKDLEMEETAKQKPTAPVLNSPGGWSIRRK